MDHGHARLEGLGRVRLVLAGGGERHVKIIEHGNEPFEEGFVGELDGFLAFALGAFLVVLQVGGGAQEALPVLLGLGRAILQIVKLRGRQGFRHQFIDGGRLTGLRTGPVFFCGHRVFHNSKYSSETIHETLGYTRFGGGATGMCAHLGAAPVVAGHRPAAEGDILPPEKDAGNSVDL